MDCSHLNYSTPVAEEVLAAAKKVNILLSFKVSVVGSYWQSVFFTEKIEQKRRGWVDEADKKRKILRLPALHYAMKLHGRIGVGKAYDEGNICSVVLSHQLRGCSLSRQTWLLKPLNKNWFSCTGWRECCCQRVEIFHQKEVKLHQKASKTASCWS